MATHPDTGGQWVTDPSGIFEWKSNGEPGGTEARPLIPLGSEPNNSIYAVAIGMFDGEDQAAAEAPFVIFQDAPTTTKMLVGDGKVAEVPIASLPPASQEQIMEQQRQNAADAAAARAYLAEAYRQAPPPAPLPPPIPDVAPPPADGMLFVPGGVITRTDPYQLPVSSPPVTPATTTPVIPFIPAPPITEVVTAAPPAPRPAPVSTTPVIPFMPAPPFTEVLTAAPPAASPRPAPVKPWVTPAPIGGGEPFLPPANIDPIPVSLPKLTPLTPAATGANPETPPAISTAATSASAGLSPAHAAAALAVPNTNLLLAGAGVLVALLIGAALWGKR